MLERWRRSPCLWKQDSRATCTHLHGARSRNRTERETMLQTSRPAPESSCLQRSSLSKLLQGSQQCHQQTNERQVHPVLFPCACLAISFLLINSWKRNCWFEKSNLSPCFHIYKPDEGSSLPHSSIFSIDPLKFCIFTDNMLKWLSYTQQTQMDIPASLLQNN